MLKEGAQEYYLVTENLVNFLFRVLKEQYSRRDEDEVEEDD